MSVKCHLIFGSAMPSVFRWAECPFATQRAEWSAVCSPAERERRAWSLESVPVAIDDMENCEKTMENLPSLGHFTVVINCH